MRKEKMSNGLILYIIIFLLFVTYFLFPSWYISLSQKLFLKVYTYQTLVEIETISVKQFYNKEKFTPLSVIARPPQTPYDSLLTSIPEEEVDTSEGKYIYNRLGIPIGYIQEKRNSTYAVILFSSPLSKELFSINDFVTNGIGTGSGSFFLQAPLEKEIRVGDPIIHQITNEEAGRVISIEKLHERNIQHIVSVIKSNPFETSVVYLQHNGKKRIEKIEIENSIDQIEEIILENQQNSEIDT